MIKVSVCTITYEHEKYIAKCIEGVLMQEGDFELEFIISLDKSPDNTKQIIEEYITTHPKGNCIRFIDRQENIGIIPNFYDTINSSTGDYIAICDGDDFWTNPLKLQKQIEFLKNNEDYILVGHNVEIFDDKTSEIINTSFPFKEKKIISNDFIFQKNYIPALSIMFKNIHKLPDWILECKIGDYPLILHCTQYGKVGLLNDVMASYRSNSGYHSTVTKKKQMDMQISSLEIVVSKLNLTKVQKDLLNYQLLHMKINNVPLLNSLNSIFNANISYRLKLKSLMNKILC
ncbi:glycosyltransferase [Empedobacter brevis]